jgi:Sulfotransferase domain
MNKIVTSTSIRPNFFILGAPKCGTTSLAAWLSQHPNIYMSPTKEPHYFNTDHKRLLNSLRSYERLFAGANEKQSAIGEASVWYLSSTEAVKNILAYNRAAKFIVMLRNPVDMAPSLHEELVFTGREDVTDFAAAWSLQEARARGEHLPRMVWEPKYVQYGDLCRLGAQVKRLLNHVPRERVKFLFLDDMHVDSGAVYREALQFLGVPDDGRTVFPIQNQAKERRWRNMLAIAWAASVVKRALRIERGFGLWGRLDTMNRIERPREPMGDDMRKSLQDYFSADTALLQELVRRDLSAWRPMRIARPV